MKVKDKVANTVIGDCSYCSHNDVECDAGGDLRDKKICKGEYIMAAQIIDIVIPSEEELDNFIFDNFSGCLTVNDTDVLRKWLIEREVE